MTSLKIELNRRLRLFQEAGVNHINKYQQLYNEGAVSTPLPYLIVIVDEFAEMKTEQSEVAQEFVRIARLGRAPGLCLVLAMQKAGRHRGWSDRGQYALPSLPAGSPRSRIAGQCSGDPDAAYVTGVGRAYFQVGVKEQYSLFQVAYGGAAYDEAVNRDDEDLDVRKIGLDGHAEILDLPLTEEQRREHQERAKQRTRTQLEAVVTELIETAERNGIPALKSPWLPPLPEKVSLQGVLAGTAWDPTCLDTCQFADPATKERLLSPGGWDGSQWTSAKSWMAPDRRSGRRSQPAGAVSARGRSERKRPHGHLWRAGLWQDDGPADAVDVADPHVVAGGCTYLRARLWRAPAAAVSRRRHTWAR